jgi:hypothetical protein
MADTFRDCPNLPQLAGVSVAGQIDIADRSLKDGDA